uniref:RNase H domain-containing protein n=1 Tax=Mesocestoides corti TaxID=53468 RepID=A0A5K3FI24_MESCO
SSVVKCSVVWQRKWAQRYWATWPQLNLCPSAFQWQARMMSSQPENDVNEEQYIISGVASVVDSDGGRLTLVMACDWSMKPDLLYQSSLY